ncbi:MAG TPA: heme ABC exporter ATP-binding protein CcmA [Gemmatimonadales bacterium]|jgi:heme ABC exporter ATP-binding subunit CcmA|nr:heme ABC exporter ATP-binding protein CcmA [Gemmatimonadales bacterium]
MPSSDGGILAAVGLERSFGHVRVLRGIDLEVLRGDVLVVVGPNGAGKTTLLRVLAGLVRPSAGEVRVLGRKLERSAPEARRPIGFVSHQSLLYDDLTLAENVALAARLYGMASPRAAAMHALQSVELAERAHQRPRELSRGLLQRAAVARALVHEPLLLLLDEPFTGLDAPAAERLRELLLERQRRGQGLLLVTHHLEEAWDLATRVAVLSGGRWLLEEGRAGPLVEFLPRYRALVHA